MNGNLGVSVLIYGQPGIGKALANGSRVLTPDRGPVPIECLKVGERVVDPDGGFALVEGVFPQGMRGVYRLSTRDGASVLCTREHLWTVQTHFDRSAKKDRTIETQDMIGRVKQAEDSSGWSRNRYFLSLTQPIEYSNSREVSSLPIHPYLLGVILGDGCLAPDGVSVCSPDEEVTKRAFAYLPPEVTPKCYENKTGSCPTWKLTAERCGHPPGESNSLLKALHALELFDHRSHEKFIPHVYAIASASARAELLWGLMDTDGECMKQGTAIFNTSSPMLASGVVDLVRGLGGIASVTTRDGPRYMHKGEKLVGRRAFRVNVRLPFNVFTLSRKASRWRKPTMARAIVSIEPEGTAECTCITTSSKRGLFLTEGHIVTHNSTDTGYALRNAHWLQTEPGGLHPVIRCVGYEPKATTLFDRSDPGGEVVRALNSEILPGIKSGNIKYVVLDTGSELAERMLAALAKSTKDPRQAYMRIGDTFLEILRDLIAAVATAGAWFVCICHEQPFRIDEKTGVRIRGGPAMPGKALGEKICRPFDIVLRAKAKETLGRFDRLYECNPLSSEYIMKDRFGVTMFEQPMELAPLVYSIKNPDKEIPEAIKQKVLKVAGA